MRYTFPHHLTLDEVRSVIQRHNARTATQAFIEIDRGDHIVFNYVVAFAHSFPRPDTRDAALNREYTILRECRGLIMCPTTGTVLARRYHKFFNVGERDESPVIAAGRQIIIMHCRRARAPRRHALQSLQ